MGVIAIFLGIIAAIVIAVLLGSELYRISALIFTISVSVIIILVVIGNSRYEYRVLNSDYSEKRIVITTIGADQIGTDGRLFFIKKDSKFKAPETLKLGQIITVYYVPNSMLEDVIMYIEQQ